MGISWVEIRVGVGACGCRIVVCRIVVRSLRGAVLPGRKDERSEASSALGDARTESHAKKPRRKEDRGDRNAATEFVARSLKLV